jgi:hypothetical protein
MIEDVYQSLRAQILARHFAVGRYYPAYHFTSGNGLGEWPRCLLPRDGVARIGCGKSGSPAACVPNDLMADGRWVPRYTSADSVLAMEAGQQAVERWRVWRHDRTNALTMAGLRITSLSIEHRLGSTVAVKAIDRWLDSIEGCSSGANRIRPSPAMSCAGTRRRPISGRPRSTPLDARRPSSPRLSVQPGPATCQGFTDSPLRAAIRSLPSGGRCGKAGRPGRWRLAEPSIDEYTGLVTAYLQIHEAFSADLGSDAGRATRRGSR